MMHTPPLPNRKRELFLLLRPFSAWILLSAVTGIIAGMATVALLAMVNQVLAATMKVNGEALLIFVALCVAALIGRALSHIAMNRVGQDLVAQIRMRLAQKILSAPIDALERYRSYRLIPVLTQDVDMISDMIFVLATTLVSVVTVLGCLAFLAWLSLPLLGILVLALVLGGAIQVWAQVKGVAGFWKARDHEEELHKAYRDISQGAKELRMQRGRRSRMFRRRIEHTIKAIRDVNSRAINIYVLAAAYGSALYFLLIALILGWAAFHPVDMAVLSGFVLILLFLKGPVEQIMGVLPEVGRAKVAFQRIAELSASFANPEPHLHLDGSAPPATLEEGIELREVRYAFPSATGVEQPFTLGPLNLALKRGELLFIVGDNGSGKTTLIKLLLGLYRPQQGSILLDGKPVTDEDRDDYRQLFTTVFADFHLFDELLPTAGEARSEQVAQAAAHYLQRLEIAHKVSIKDDAFTTLDLSTGQRKRLALVHAYLEGRPVLVFDEWAADQDPTFRHLFYTELLPELRELGHLVIAISHDDRYFHLADRVVRMAGGQIVEDHPSTPQAAQQQVAVV
ncbi:ABC-type siderophore (cyclic peptide) export system protein [Herbaspirillum rubrisubalbicans M1]|uniref:cyclic peptide export ABC transporter n=1 Tax=Herbaspirillum rubrisubalbicans TaxID=80842 RepID=UPI00073A4532|nr:cyclic peptide export ABC transporter [Herbaspirillum rubrisubalbicans]ALU89452.1 ABC-type siderophore (cyclic peptide) export system protein [Herbaspirillum rubrisubalbicans M1]